VSQSLTLVLPVHNAEATLPRQVEELLTIAGELTPRFELLVIDDGSSDDTYEIASELATRFPQIRVTRHAHRRGLGPTLRSLRGRVTTDVVIVSDGALPLNGEQVRRLWLERCGAQIRLDGSASAMPSAFRVEELQAPSRIHSAMAATHRRLGGLELLPEGDLAIKVASNKVAKPLTPVTPTKRLRRSGIGQIPTLPVAKFLNSVTAFALGE
jgi:hypothetical protein